MSAISQLKAASHFGISFPYTSCTAKIKYRHHAHVYVQTDGGEVEKLGLALREFSFSIPAHDTLRPPFRNFYSQVLPQLWAKWQSGETGPLVVPSIGTVQAMASDATRKIGASASGEPVDVSLIEDSRTLSTLSAVFTPSVSSLPTQLRAVVQQGKGIVEQSLLDRLTAAVSRAMALAAQGEVFARQWTARVSEVVNLCEAIYQSPALLLPTNAQLLITLLTMHEAAVITREDARRRGRPVLTWPTLTPVRMSVAQIAAWIYGDTSRVGELLALNDWNPLDVPPRSVVRHYA